MRNFATLKITSLAALAALAASAALLAPLSFPAIASASVSLGEPNVTSLSSGLVGYWPLDGATTNWKTGITSDLSGQGNNGQLIAMSTTTSPVIGKIGQAMKFTGATGVYINAGTGSSLNVTGNVLTISAWVRRATPTSSGAIFNKGLGGAAGYVLQIQGDNTVKLTKYGIIDIYIGSFPADTAWHHLVGVWDGAGERLYIDGALNATSNNTANFNSSSAYQARIGAYNDGTLAFGGTIDDVRVYNRALSAQEVALLYAAGAAHVDQSNTVALSNGLVGYWPLDGSTINWKTGTIQDLSGQGNNGKPVGMSTTTSPTTGKIGQALMFKTSSTYVQAPSLLTGATKFTESAWVNFNSLPNSYPSIINRGTSWDGSIFLTSGPKAAVQTGGSWTPGATILQAGRWYQILATYDGATVRLYVNGIQDASYSFSSALGSQSTTIIGGIPSYSFDGKIDDVRIYNRALSAQEIQQLYALGNTNADHSNTVTLSTGLVGYWTFDGGAMNWKTGTALDSSGQGNNGSLVSMSTTTSPTIGKIGQALKFDGSTSYVTAGGSGVPSAGAARTISLWINQASRVNGAGHAMTYFNSGGSGQGFCLELATLSGTTYLFTDSVNGGNNITVTGTQIPSLNSWHHIVFTFNGATAYAYYLDGSLAKSGNFTVAINTNVTGFDIGRGPGGGSLWHGSLDDVRIYNRALSAAEVRQLYLLGK